MGNTYKRTVEAPASNVDTAGTLWIAKNLALNPYPETYPELTGGDSLEVTINLTGGSVRIKEKGGPKPEETICFRIVGPFQGGESLYPGKWPTSYGWAFSRASGSLKNHPVERKKTDKPTAEFILSKEAHGHNDADTMHDLTDSDFTFSQIKIRFDVPSEFASPAKWQAQAITVEAGGDEVKHLP